MALMTPGTEAEEYRVRGYASTFDRYALFEDEDGTVWEQIDPHAFDDADLTDVIFQYDHAGKVFARSTNGSLVLSVDGHGLLVEADLSLTEASRAMWEEIRAGLVTRMSFCFTVTDGRYDRATSTNRIYRIGKVYDVSAVSIPANPGTEIEARCAQDGEILRYRAERREKSRRLKNKIHILQLQGGLTHD